MTEIHTGKSKNQDHSTPTSREKPGSTWAVGNNNNAISSTYKFFQDDSPELFKDAYPRGQDFNPMSFFRVLKRSLINLHYC